MNGEYSRPGDVTLMILTKDGWREIPTMPDRGAWVLDTPLTVKEGTLLGLEVGVRKLAQAARSLDTSGLQWSEPARPPVAQDTKAPAPRNRAERRAARRRR